MQAAADKPETVACPRQLFHRWLSTRMNVQTTTEEWSLIKSSLTPEELRTFLASKYQNNKNHMNPLRGGPYPSTDEEIAAYDTASY